MATQGNDPFPGLRIFQPAVISKDVLLYVRTWDIAEAVFGKGVAPSLETAKHHDVLSTPWEKAQIHDHHLRAGTPEPAEVSKAGRLLGEPHRKENWVSVALEGSLSGT